jgi:Putative sensor
MSSVASDRLPHRRNPVRLVFSPGLWAGAGYLLTYLAVGWALFGVVFAITVASATLSITLAGLPMLIGAAAVVRGCANVERARLRMVSREPVRGRYRPVTKPGIMGQLKTRWRDPATWRDVAYLLGLWIPLTILDAVVAAIWLFFLAGLTLPLWYGTQANSCVGACAPGHAHGVQLGYFPHGPAGPGASGLYVTTLPKALLVAAICLVPFLLFNYVLVATARTHARAARALLRPPSDPLAEAKSVLSRPGPLPSFMPNDTGPHPPLAGGADQVSSRGRDS